MVLNRYPLWKNILILLVVVLGFLYAFPNVFVDDPAIQISRLDTILSLNDTATINTIQQALQTAKLPYKKIETQDRSLLIRFSSTDTQLLAKDALQQALGKEYLVALNLAPATPAWLKTIHAIPMKLGLDLRGGVHFLLQVGVDSVIDQRIEGDINNINQVLRSEHIRYTDLNRQKESVYLQFRDAESLENAANVLNQHFPEFIWKKSQQGKLFLQGVLSPQAVIQQKQEILEQSMNTLRNLVNELGVSEAVVQQQGSDRVAIDLPGIQDTAQAKNILGKTATLEFHMVDTEHDARMALGGIVPPDTKLYQYQGAPVLLKNQVILRGSSITGARSGFSEDARPAVDIRLGGGEEALFSKTTAENIGKPMAVLYVEVKSEPKLVNGKEVINYVTEKRVISVATIQSALGNSFQITGLSSQDEARTLAILLRAGALPAPDTIIEERQLGPTLGKQNIHRGLLSVEVGFVLVVIFAALYYGVMGIIADVALIMNLILIVAILSILGATLTLPGIAGIVLTVGMAVDANVLIFERIREELRNGLGIQSAIHAGYERAFVTIVDANMTTLIVAAILFGLGSGTVKSFAVTLTIGLVTSMFTAIIGTRAIVNLIYGSRPVKNISIGL